MLEGPTGRYELMAVSRNGPISLRTKEAATSVLTEASRARAKARFQAFAPARPRDVVSHLGALDANCPRHWYIATCGSRGSISCACRTGALPAAPSEK